MALSRIFKQRPKGAGPPSGSPGKRCYAIGDIHGRLDLLTDLMQRIADHDLSRPTRETVIVTLGDIIDRGPDSRGVVEYLRRPPGKLPRMVHVKGNHEESLIRGLSGELGVLVGWLETGGLECARSYGVDVGSLFGQAPDAAEYTLASRIPPDDIRFMDGFVDSVRFGDYLLVHAGVRPGVKLEDQQPQDLRWIRGGFLDSQADFGFTVVHGHSVSADIEERPNRIGIDTGAYRTGVLTAIWIEDDQRGFLQTKGDAETPATA